MNLNEIKNKTYNQYLTIFAVVVLFIIMLLSTNGFYWADDFGFMSDLNDQGIFANCYEGYFRWDGRFLSVGSFFQCFNLVYLSIETIIFIYTLCVLLSGILMFYILNLEINLQFRNQSQRFFIMLMFPIILWLGSLIHACETIYWGTGGSYSFDLLLGSIWVLLFLKLQNFKINLIYQILFLIFSFAVGGLTQNLSMPLITLAFITIICNILENKKTNVVFNFLILIFVISGLVFIMIAPGNWLRIKDEKTVVDIFNILILIKNYFYVLIKFASRSIFAIVAAGILAVSAVFINNSKLSFPKLVFFKIPKSRLDFIIFLQDYKWLLAAASSALPFMAIPLFSGRRTVIYFGYFIMIFVFLQTIKFYNKATLTENIAVKNRNTTIAKIGFLIILFSSFGLSVQNLIKGAVLKKAITERENILKKSRGKTIHLRSIRPELSTICFQFADYPYTGAYVKSSQERYFGVKIILDK